MNPTSVIALFCEDIREEMRGLHTIVGILPDNLSGESDANAEEGTSPVIPKLCVYARLHFDPNNELGEITSRLLFPNGETRDLELFQSEAVSRAKAQGIKQQSPIVGVYSRMVFLNFPILSNGQLQLEVSIQGMVYVAGFLNINVSKVSPSVSPPPS